MLRWKTPSAVCALLITACPHTSFAQQIVRPAPPEISILQTMAPLKIPGQIRKVAYEPLVPLVSPQEAVAGNPTLQPPTGAPAVRTAALNPAINPVTKPALTPPIQVMRNPINPPRSTSSTYRPPHGSQPAVERAMSPDVVIRTPFVQPHNPNLYLFVVENIGSVDATMATVDLYVPQGGVITNVVPATATRTSQRANIRLTDLKAGAKSIIEVEISPTTDVVEFQTRMSLESVHKFTTSANPNFVVQSQPRINTPRSIVRPTEPLLARTSQVSEVVGANDPFGEPRYAAGPAMLGKSSLTPLNPLSVEAPQPPRPSSQTTPVNTQVATAPTADANAATAATTDAAISNVAISNAAISNAAISNALNSAVRSGKAQPPNLTNAVMVDNTATKARLVSATKVAAQATADAKLSATVDGPVVLDANQLADFSITVTNPNTSDATGIIVQLNVPTGLKITVLDRDAWFDEENQTISWEISKLASGKQETIQYKAVGQVIGQQNQKVTIGMQDVYQGKAQLVTLVAN